MTNRGKFYPWAASIPNGLAVKLATLFGLGKLKAPGTWGSAAGVLFYVMFFDGIGNESIGGFARYVVFASFLAYIAAGVCDTAERALKMRDPGCINLDEFVAMNFCFLPVVSQFYSVYGLFLGFALFRFFDIRKPLGIYAVQSLEGGVGCVADDIAAAVLSCSCLNIIGLALPSIYVQY